MGRWGEAEKRMSREIVEMKSQIYTAINAKSPDHRTRASTLPRFSPSPLPPLSASPHPRFAPSPRPRFSPSPHPRFSPSRAMMVVTGIVLIAGAVFSQQTASPSRTPLDPKLPTLFLIGDSTVNNSTNGQLGWGTPIASFFDKSKINVANRARG